MGFQNWYTNPYGPTERGQPNVPEPPVPFNTAPRPGELVMPGSQQQFPMPSPWLGAPREGEFGGFPQAAEGPQPPIPPAPDKTGVPGIPGGYPGPTPPGPRPGPTPPGTDAISEWEKKGYVDPQGMVTLFTGEKIKLAEALKRYYPDRPPRANEIPPWVSINWGSAYGVPIRYVEQIPPDLRSMFQTLFDQAYTGNMDKPAVSSMKPSTQYQ